MFCIHGYHFGIFNNTSLQRVSQYWVHCITGPLASLTVSYNFTGGQDQDKRALLVMSPAKAPSGFSQKDLQETVVYFYSLLR